MPLEQQLSLDEIQTKLTGLKSTLSRVIQNNINDPDTNISILKKLEKNEYKPLIRQLAYKQSSEELKALITPIMDYIAAKL